MTPIKVMVADDHRMVREGLVSILESLPGANVVAQASDGIEAVEMAREKRPDVLVVDIAMPRLNGLEVVRRVKEDNPEMGVLVLTMHEEEEYVVHLVKAGADGFLLKDSAGDELLAAVKSIHAGRGYFGAHASKVLADQYRRPTKEAEDPYGALTPREREVFHLIVEGNSTKEIARSLDISVKTAENHRSRVLEKLDVKNTVELVRYAARRGLLD